MQAEEQIYTYRITRKVRTGGSGCLSFFFAITGLITLFLFWPLGILLLIAAFLTDTKTGTISTCGHCGNEVAHSSLLCPTCRADLAAEPRHHRWFR